MDIVEIKRIVSNVVNRHLNEGAYKRYNVNMSYPWAKPHRTAKKMSDDELKDKLTNVWKKIYQRDNNDEQPPTNIKRLFNDIMNICGSNSERQQYLKELSKDIEKVDFDWENCDYIGDLRDHNGVKYLKYRVGGDWESPIAMFVYHDGNHIRAYIPIRGNAINLKGGKKKNEKVAFGNWDDADAEFCKSEGIDCQSARDYVEYNKDVVEKDFKKALKVVK